ncbi:MAG TPA: toll/interleukin-1 receptor domain-containing protein [Thermoanaerobaculia bacterium]|nr:toll/interleukin-1 receptor domain-containing protein [Thermoanaerobaculia bacterium]
MAATPPSVFLSYSHKDAVWMKRLADHLRLYELEKLLTVWDDRQIRAGQDWLPEIESAIGQAQVAILLISNDFLISPFIRGQEVSPILERRSRDGLLVFPVIVKACNWQDVPWLQGIQARPPGKSLYGLKGDAREEALAAIAKEIRKPLHLEPRTQASVSSRSAVHQLPSPPLDFTGRAAELDALRVAEREGRTTAIFGLRGMGGVGKTTLALKLAQEVAPLYPDGQIFLDLLGVTTPLSAAEAMAHVM